MSVRLKAVTKVYGGGRSAVAALDRAGIPWTAFKYSENTGQFQVIREQAGTFADSIKLWSGATS